MNLTEHTEQITPCAVGEMFRTNALFGGIPAEALDNLGIVIEERTCEPGEIVFDEGDEGQNLYLVGRGTVMISKKGRGGEQETLTWKNPGSFFGEMALLDQLPRSARATCMETTVMGKVDRAGLERLLAHSPNAAMHFTRSIMQGLRSMNSLFIDELIHAERMSLVGKMMSAIVHDFRNPLASIMMAGEWLEGTEDPKLQSKGAILHRATDRMQAMIQELLDYSRGHSQLDAEATTVKDLINDLGDQILNALPEDKVEVRREIGYDGPITVDRNRFMRLLCNVVKNAVEAMPGGGRLTVRANRSDNLIEFEVEDTGTGIPPDVLPRIFEPFVTHGKASGTGLGMAIAKSVVEAHGGTISMESEEGHGTVCRIALPTE